MAAASPAQGVTAGASPGGEGVCAHVTPDPADGVLFRRSAGRPSGPGRHPAPPSALPTAMLNDATTATPPLIAQAPSHRRGSRHLRPPAIIEGDGGAKARRIIQHRRHLRGSSGNI
jgi:hypothetical protein